MNIDVRAEAAGTLSGHKGSQSISPNYKWGNCNLCRYIHICSVHGYTEGAILQLPPPQNCYKRNLHEQAKLWNINTP
ncbi:hypothetical protein POVWA2_076590 [Plasmodium ovale wallikeri]|uniref:Uncharacterized protein n=1 Tax=Plasmodium ovale wallikeri TaxID=864142 RepID=A0A1A9ALN2_PLAOA|nr:hypothetical protein POVWA1_002250 [Plasmodium ovale wallikeri]SBT56990.1 hypothetical protein POVWA2_076590 [Plasmodium ovale wallikeri]